MRQYDSLDIWSFKLTDDVPSKLNEVDDSWKIVEIPHTWNGWDGQDGDSDYYRGKGVYTLELERPDVPKDFQLYLEFEGVNAVAEVYANGEKLAEHRGGYSSFRVNISDAFVEGRTLLAVVADNSHFEDVYPQSADFTFYGGIYRPVTLIAVPNTHFDLDFYGSQGMNYETRIEEDFAKIQMRAWVSNPDPGDSVRFTIYDEEGLVVSETFTPAVEEVEVTTTVVDPHLWQGVEDPYLYTLEAEIWRNNNCLDTVTASLGIREFYVDPEKGFYLNGKQMPLRGVAKHQDFLGVGNALEPEHFMIDAKHIYDIGANTVRLAHYQHAQDFYDLCDTLGFVVWAEIPFISIFNEDPAARENTISQMKELVYQNMNHPSILFWGIGNELTIGKDSPELIDNLYELNTLTKEIDPTRMTTIAQFNTLPFDSEHNFITDTVSYNIYYGWYMGGLNDNEKWMDAFHEANPDIPIGVSEYGSEGITRWHTDNPQNKDYTEEYHAKYHEHMVKIIDEREYLWATHLWNMFDFGADNRDEGGIKGRNNKGLVTLDRKTRKDAFYIYKAYWSREPFAHITGRRYAQRPYDQMTVKVYSNLDELTLNVNGEEFATLAGDKIFEFEDVPLVERFTTLSVHGEFGVVDQVTFEKVAEPNPEYVLPKEAADDREGVRNWFEEEVDVTQPAPEMTFNEGYFSIRDKVKDVLTHDEAREKFFDTVYALTDFSLAPSTLAMLNESSISEIGSFIGIFDKDSDDFKWVNSSLQTVKK